MGAHGDGGNLEGMMKGLEEPWGPGGDDGSLGGWGDLKHEGGGGWRESGDLEGLVGAWKMVGGIVGQWEDLKRVW